MPSASAALARCKDPGSVHCRIWSQAEIPAEKPPPEVPSRDLVCDSSRYLIRKNIYPDAGNCTSVISISAIDDEPERNRLRDLIMHVAYMRPGDLVFGAVRLPRYKAACMLYYQTAGFSSEDADLLTWNLRHDPLTESSEDTELDPKNEAESSFS